MHAAPRYLAICCATALALLWIILSSTRDRERDGRLWLRSDREALARVIRSEIGSGTRQQRLHVAWATRNLAAERGQSIAEMACRPCGRQGPRRPVSTRQPARAEDRALARSVLAAPAALDPTGGATHFLDPRLQDRLARSGRVRGYAGQTYARVERRWKRRYGWERYRRLGPELELWGPKKRPLRGSLRSARPRGRCRSRRCG